MTSIAVKIIGDHDSGPEMLDFQPLEPNGSLNEGGTTVNGIMSIVRSSLGGDAIAEISDSLGEGLGKTAVAAGTALPMLISALSYQAGQDNGEALRNALERDHDGEILRDVKSFVAAGDFSAGGDILGHVLGDRKSKTARAISNSTGMTAGNVDRLLDMLAPVVMGAVGKIKKARRLDSQNIADLLTNEETEIDRQLPGVISAVGVFLDTDKDGETELTDLMVRGRNLLTKFI